MKVAIVYDRLNKWGGAERVLLAFRSLFPSADWYTSLWDKNGAPFSRDWRVTASWLNKIPFLRSHHEWIPYLMPFIFESFSFNGYDLVISISSEAAKGIITSPNTYHINYCLTPTRYLYSHKKTYLTNPLFRLIGDILRRWDQVAATRPDEMISISTQVKNRIRQYYKRDSDVIFPPVDTKKFTQYKWSKQQENVSSPYYLIVSRLVPYKNLETAIRAFQKLPAERLVVIGRGVLENHLKKIASNNVTFIRQVADEELVVYYANARGLIHPCVEDFGLVMVEAQAAGTAVLARRGGGAIDIVQDGKTGMLYDGSGVDDLVTAIKAFAQKSFDPALCQQNAKKFDIHIWETKIRERLKDYVK